MKQIRQPPKSRPKPTTPACGTCAHVFEVTADPPQGFCRRYPPHLKVDGISSAFAPVKLEWKCGEWAKA